MIHFCLEKLLKWRNMTNTPVSFRKQTWHSCAKDFTQRQQHKQVSPLPKFLPTIGESSGPNSLFPNWKKVENGRGANCISLLDATVHTYVYTHLIYIYMYVYIYIYIYTCRFQINYCIIIVININFSVWSFMVHSYSPRDLTSGPKAQTERAAKRSWSLHQGDEVPNDLLMSWCVYIYIYVSVCICKYRYIIYIYT